MWQLSAASQDFKKNPAYALVRNSSGTLDFLKFTFQNKFPQLWEFLHLYPFHGTDLKKKSICSFDPLRGKPGVTPRPGTSMSDDYSVRFHIYTSDLFRPSRPPDRTHQERCNGVTGPAFAPTILSITNTCSRFFPTKNHFILHTCTENYSFAERTRRGRRSRNTCS